MRTTITLIVMLVLIAIIAIWGLRMDPARTRLTSPGPIKVGIVHSMTGPLAPVERPMVDAETLAIEEINARGGLLGRNVQAIVVDGASDPKTFAQAAEKLISSDQVCTVIGGYTTSSRLAMKAVFERRNHLLIYPTNYEGLEESPNIIYTGAAPNQQITPAITWWMLNHPGHRFFLAGTDSVWAHAVNAIICDHVKALGGQIVGEEYLPLGSSQAQDMINQIKAASPDVIISTIDGQTNVPFYAGLHRAGIAAGTTPVIGLSFAETALQDLGQDVRTQMAGNYGAWCYFQNLDTPRNAEFVSSFKKRFGADRVTDALGESAYNSVRLLAQAIEVAGSANVDDIRSAISEQTLSTPEGIVSVDRSTHHTWHVVIIGKIRPDGQYDPVWSSEKPIRPVPFPVSRTRKEWASTMETLNAEWIQRNSKK